MVREVRLLIVGLLNWLEVEIIFFTSALSAYECLYYIESYALADLKSSKNIEKITGTL